MVGEAISHYGSYSSEGRPRFIREAKAAAVLDHPNIYSVHEIDEIEGETFIAMA